MAMLPRNEDETREAWIDRNMQWAASPEGVAAAAKKAAVVDADELLLHETWAREVKIPLDYVDALFHPERAAILRHSVMLETAALVAVRESRDRIVVLVGGPGTGKTTAACWWLRGLPAERALFVRAQALSRWERYSMARMDELLLPERLVVDDLGGEYADVNGNFLAVLQEVLVDRYENGRRTVMTTNISKADFLERYDKKIGDRMRESGVFFGVGNDSMRKEP